jgi:hypothetical protein
MTDIVPRFGLELNKTSMRYKHDESGMFTGTPVILSGNRQYLGRSRPKQLRDDALINACSYYGIIEVLHRLKEACLSDRRTTYWMLNEPSSNR